MALNYSGTSPTAIKYSGTDLTVLKYVILPNEYQQVEYIESSGTQWIETNYVVNNNSKIQLDMMFGSNASSAYTGIYNVLAVRRDYGYLGTGWLQLSTAFNQNQRYSNVVLAIENGNGYISNNGVTLTSSTIDVSSNTQTFPLLATKQNNSITRYQNGRIYSCRIFDNSNLVREFIPCYRKSDNVIGMYDLVNKSFYTNAGSGTFLKGIDVVAVWAKPYSLSISQGSNTTVTVTRVSSVNQGASTGTLSSGSVVYYGDVLTINYSVSSGYNISTHTVNGTTFTSGQSFTVTSAISVVTTAIASASWKTVWTGTMKCGKPWKYTTSVQTNTFTGFTGVSGAYQTRITGTFSWYEETSWGGGTMSFSALEQYHTIRQNTLNTQGNISDFTQGAYSGTPPYCFMYFEVTGNETLQFTARTFYETGGYWNMISPNSYDSLIITKVEQYY